MIYTLIRDGIPTPSTALRLNILVLPVTALIPPKIVEADANNFLDVTALATNASPAPVITLQKIPRNRRSALDHYSGPACRGLRSTRRCWDRPVDHARLIEKQLRVLMRLSTVNLKP
ncbi:hypothetical protein JFT81_12210 [Pseudomonas sp. TH43]|uniref:hypothetical protein n=1 Tax=Pseudomonas sp. TH43 TaxID=2796407 RepID=UPI001913E887|nr:hypothetical protein [Pseudomonas sp. TH43]MBK5375393.1 hypothetical protein [Pseudomonas sp. TH43]